MPERIIVVAAFDRDENGELVPAFDPRMVGSEGQAKMEAKELSAKHAGVIAWSRSANPDLGEYGEPTVLASYGDVPEME